MQKEITKPFYFTHLETYNNPRNKYQEAVLAFLMSSATNRLISDPEQYKSNLVKVLDDLNRHHPRCGKLSFDFWVSGKCNGMPEYRFSVGDSLFRFALLPVIPVTPNT